MLKIEISENMLKDFESSVGTEVFNKLKEKGDTTLVVAITLHKSSASELVNLKETMMLLGWEEPTVAVSASGAGSQDEDSAEPTEFEILIKAVKADKKIAAIKALRSFENKEASKLSLGEAKALVDGVADKHISFQNYSSKASAEEDAKKLEGIGEVEVRGI